MITPSLHMCCNPLDRPWPQSRHPKWHDHGSGRMGLSQSTSIHTKWLVNETDTYIRIVATTSDDRMLSNISSLPAGCVSQVGYNCGLLFNYTDALNLCSFGVWRCASSFETRRCRTDDQQYSESRGQVCHPVVEVCLSRIMILIVIRRYRSSAGGGGFRHDSNDVPIAFPS